MARAACILVVMSRLMYYVVHYVHIYIDITLPRGRQAVFELLHLHYYIITLTLTLHCEHYRVEGRRYLSFFIFVLTFLTCGAITSKTTDHVTPSASHQHHPPSVTCGRSSPAERSRHTPHATRHTSHNSASAENE